jgi:hypothetical protein
MIHLSDVELLITAIAMARCCRAKATRMPCRWSAEKSDSEHLECSENLRARV